MELSAQLPADLAALLAPAGRAPPELLRPPSGAPVGAAPATPFDLVLLELAGTAMPSGDALPVSGNGLPSVPADSPTEDSGAPLDPLSVSALLALVAPPPAQPLPAAAAPAVPAAVAGSPARSIPGAAPPLPQEAPSVQGPTDALARAAVPATVLPEPGDALTAPSGGPAEHALADAAAVEQPAPAGAAPSPHAAQPPASMTSNSERVMAALAAAQSAPVAEAAASSAPPPLRAISEPRPNAERRSANAAATVSVSTASDTPSANAAPLPQPFVLTPAAGTADGPAAAPQSAHAADPLPLVAAPRASAADADAQSLPPAHSPAFTAAHGASALDGSPAQSAAAPLAHQGGSVDTTAARWHDALASRVQWLVDHDVGEARIKLNPPELGALDVKISLHDDKTFVQLTAHSSAARDELSQSLPRLRELLSANGLELGGATVSGGHDGRAGRYFGAEPAPRGFGFAPASSPEPVARAARTASSRIDVFA